MSETIKKTASSTKAPTPEGVKSKEPPCGNMNIDSTCKLSPGTRCVNVPLNQCKPVFKTSSKADKKE